MNNPTWSKFNILATSIVIISLLIQSEAYLPRLEVNRLCRLRTGLTDRDLVDHKTRNEECSIDCITKQGTVMTAFVDDGSSCHDTEGYKCVLGTCRPPQYSLSDDFKELNDVQIAIKTAFVADRDPYPGQGESDAFVVVEAISGGEPLFRNGEVMCHTHIVQDNSRPIWHFTCKPLPLSSLAKLRFVVLDSDKPDTNPQYLGSTTYTLETLMNKGPQKLFLDQGDLSGGPYFLEVDVKGQKYVSSD